MILKIIFIILLLLILAAALFAASRVWPRTKKCGKGTKEIACVGDSITYGAGVMFQRNCAFASLLPEYMGEDYYTVNYGVNARTLMSTGDLTYEKTHNSKMFWKSAPDTILFMLGTNDSKKINWNAEQYKKEYIAYVERMKNMESQPKLYVMLPPRVFKEVKTDKDCCNENIVGELIPIVKEVAAQCNVPVIDLYSFTKDHPEWFNDGVHPNKDGNEAIARKICAELKGTES